MKQLSIVIPALAIAACTESSPIKAGMWQATTELKAGQQLLWTSKVDRCITDPETDAPIPGMVSASPLGQCQAYESHYDDGHLSVRTACMGRMNSFSQGMDASKVAIDGKYAADRIDAQISVSLDTHPEAARLKGTLTARRTGDCST
jgi:uncharacterized protein DUF3617